MTGSVCGVFMVGRNGDGNVSGIFRRLAGNLPQMMLAVISPSGRHSTFAWGGYILGQMNNLPAANLGSPTVE